MLRISLKTSDLAEARRRAAALELELDMVAVTFPKRADAPSRKQLASIYSEALNFKIEQIASIQSRPPFDDEQHRLYNDAYNKLFGMIARSGTMPEKGSREVAAVLSDPAVSDAERQVIFNLVEEHTAPVGEVQREAAFTFALSGPISTALSPSGSPPIAPRHLRNYMVNANLPDTPQNLKLALPIAAAGYAEACRLANADLGARCDGIRRSAMPALLAAILFDDEGKACRASNITNQVQRTGIVADEQLKAENNQPSLGSSPDHPPEKNHNELIDLPISELCRLAIDDHNGSGEWQESAQRNAKVISDIFIAVNGDLRMSEINRTHLIALVGRLKIMPTIWGKCRDDRRGGLSAVFARGEELAEKWQVDRAKAEQEKLPTVGFSATTHNRHFNTLKQLLDYARDLEDGDGNSTHVHPVVSFNKLTQKDRRKKNKRKPVPTEAEALALVSGPIFTGCKNIDERFTPGRQVYHDGAYWVPLLLLVYGPRSNEFCQMPLANIYLDDPIPYVEIRPSAQQLVKTTDSHRRLPIAPKLIDLGFLNYVRDLRGRNETWLFPEFNQNGTIPRKVFRDKVFLPLIRHHFPNGTSRRLNGKDIDTQSMRKLAATELTKGEPQIELGLRQAFFGHTRSTTLQGIYEDDPSLEQLLVCVLKTQRLIEHVQAHPLQLRFQASGIPAD